MHSKTPAETLSWFRFCIHMFKYEGAEWEVICSWQKGPPETRLFCFIPLPKDYMKPINGQPAGIVWWSNVNHNSYMTWQIWVHEKNWLWWFLSGVRHFIHGVVEPVQRDNCLSCPSFVYMCLLSPVVWLAISIWYCVCLSFTKNKIDKFEVIIGMIFLNFLIRKNIIHLVLWRI